MIRFVGREGGDGEALQGDVVREAPTATNYRKSAAYY